MKKFFSLIAAVLFAGSMMAADATMAAGTNASTCTVNGKDGIKCGTSKNAGDMAITVGAGATSLTLYAAAWKGVNGASIAITAPEGVTATPASLAITPDDGISNNTPFTLAGTEADFKFEIALTGVSAETTLTLACSKRFVVWGATYGTGGVTPSDPVVEYYVVGTMNNWELNADYKLAANPGQAGEYMKRFTFAANDELKVRKAIDGVLDAWYPDGVGNNWVINEDGQYIVYFRPEGNTEWANNYFFVAPYVVPQYEVAEAIAAGLKENDEIKVRGVVTKMQIKGKNFANYGSACIYVKDATDAEGEFEFYNCYSFESAKFTSTIPAYDATSTAWADLTKLADANGNEIRLGDTIVAFGQYKLFGTTYELNTGCYIVDIKSAPVAPAQDINVNMSDGLIYNDYVADEGWWQIMGENDKYVVSISNLSTTQAEGTYTVADLDADYTYLSVINGTDTTDISFVDGSVTLSVDAQTGNVTVAGTLVGNDGNNYIFNLQFIVPKPTETVNVNIQNAELIDDYADYGLYGVYGMDANDIYVQIAIWAEQGFQGNFTETDLDVQYIGSAIFEGEEQVNIYTAAITVTPGNGGDYNITATLLCYNNKQYNVTMYVPAGGTAIENVDAAVKAIKRLVNGNLLIEKGNKTFNVLGATVR